MKKPKKLSTNSAVSVSTLMRQARKAKPSVAKKLRAQAAEMRKAAREAKGLTMPPAAGGIERRTDAQWRAASVQCAQNALSENGALLGLSSSIPGQGDMTGFTAPSDDVVELMALARKKDGAGLIAAKLRVMNAQARYTGSMETQKLHSDAAIKRSQQAREDAVAGFVAEYAAHIDVAGDKPGSVHIVSGFTMKHIVRALSDAGYTTRGKR